jgi:hypothetical protein
VWPVGQQLELNVNAIEFAPPSQFGEMNPMIDKDDCDGPPSIENEDPETALAYAFVMQGG